MSRDLKVPTSREFMRIDILKSIISSNMNALTDHIKFPVIIFQFSDTDESQSKDLDIKVADCGFNVKVSGFSEAVSVDYFLLPALDNTDKMEATLVIEATKFKTKTELALFASIAAALAQIHQNVIYDEANIFTREVKIGPHALLKCARHQIVDLFG